MPNAQLAGPGPSFNPTRPSTHQSPPSNAQFHIQPPSSSSHFKPAFQSQSQSQPKSLSNPPQPAPASSSSHFRYPLATAPDIIRSHQKDAYFSTILASSLSDTLRHILGARFAHTWAAETRTAAELLYFGLTTVIGNRTLGEEYCDIVQVEDDELAVTGKGGVARKGGRLPALGRRAGYVLVTVLLPYLMSTILPKMRGPLRKLLRRGLDEPGDVSSSNPSSEPKDRKRSTPSSSSSSSLSSILLLRRIQRYLLTNLDTLTSTGPIYAVSLAVFYFTGAYYHLGKRIFKLRYAFTRMVDPESGQRAGYEVLGLLLVLQLMVQAWFHVRDTFTSGADAQPASERALIGAGGDAVPSRDNISLSHTSYAENTALLPAAFESPVTGPSTTSIERLTSTPFPTPKSKPKSGSSHTTNTEPGSHFDLSDRTVMAWMPGRQERTCTLCLDPMKDPCVTTCGHVFCWTCIIDWCKEKSECPLCRQTCLGQHVLPLRG